MAVPSITLRAMRRPVLAGGRPARVPLGETVEDRAVGSGVTVTVHHDVGQRPLHGLEFPALRVQRGHRLRGKGFHRAARPSAKRQRPRIVSLLAMGHRGLRASRMKRNAFTSPSEFARSPTVCRRLGG